jgi:hypothetical protein
MNFHMRIFPPNHPSGNARWHWELRSDGDVVDCGTEDSYDLACDAAFAAMDKAYAK